jgi:hypothetical protein
VKDLQDDGECHGVVARRWALYCPDMSYLLCPVGYLLWRWSTADLLLLVVATTHVGLDLLLRPTRRNRGAMMTPRRAEFVDAALEG